MGTCGRAPSENSLGEAAGNRTHGVAERLRRTEPSRYTCREGRLERGALHADRVQSPFTNQVTTTRRDFEASVGRSLVLAAAESTECDEHK